MKYFKRKILISFTSIGGQITPASALAPKIGRFGLSMKKIGEDVAKLTKKIWDGIKIKVILLLYHKSIKFEIVPLVSSLVKREILKNDDNKKIKNKRKIIIKNIKIKQLRKIAKTIKQRSYAKNIIGTTKEILGTCSSMKVTVNKIKPKIFLKKMKSGDVNLIF